MEAKYGSGVSGAPKKRRKGRRDDYADIGAGYDESDSFIDNTDGYDEMIPPNVTTARGGFYINCGALEFKTDEEATSGVSSSSSEDENEDQSENEGDENKQRKKKRALDSSDEEDAASDTSSATQGDKQQPIKKPKISMQQAIKKKLFSPQKIKVKKRRLMEAQKKTVKNLLREKRMDLDMSVPLDASNVQDTDQDKDLPKENRTPMKMSSVAAAIESVISRVDDSMVEKIDVELEPQNKENNQNNASDTELSLQDISTTEIVKLPENLPSDIVTVIENMKKAAKEHKDGGKVRFFSGDVNVMLLNLERRCRCLGRSSRVKVYEHLSPFVRCRKETLIKRAKNLLLEDEQKKMDVTVDKLKAQLKVLMPALIASHEQESQKVLQRKFSQEAATNDELKALKIPRRRFPFSEDMKKMVKDILGFKKRCLLLEGKQKDSMETLLLEYLKRNILILWPEGWMSMVVLKKFCTVGTPVKPSPPKPTEADRHSKKITTATVPKPPMNLSQSNSALTIIPVNLNSEIDAVQKPFESIIKAVIQSDVEKRIPTDNGVIVKNTVGPKDEPVISNHCQFIDLTEASLVKKQAVEDVVLPVSFVKEKVSKPQPEDPKPVLEQPELDLSRLKEITKSSIQNDGDDVQKVMESLKALQQLSSPAKNDVSGSPVSVIAYNKSYGSNSNHSGNAVKTELVTSTPGFQDEFQKQFINSLSNLKSSSVSSKPGYSRCS